MYISSINSVFRLVTTTGVSPCSLFLKREIRTRFDHLKLNQEARVLEKQSQQKADHDSHVQGCQFFTGQTVMAKNLRQGPNWIPAVVVERLGPLSYLVETEDRELWRHHVDLLKELAVPDYRSPTATDPGGGAPAVVSPGGQPEVCVSGWECTCQPYIKCDKHSLISP